MPSIIGTAVWLSIDEVADLAYAAHYRGEALAIAIAVTKPESGRNPPPPLTDTGGWACATAIGDLALMTAVWGPSVGCWQIRTLVAETGKGTVRDKLALLSSYAQQARGAYSISGGNTTTGSASPNSGWGHWSAWKQGLHLPWLAEARKAAERRMAIGGTGSVTGGGSGDVNAIGGQLSPDVTTPPPAFPVAYTPPRTVGNIVLTHQDSRRREFSRALAELIIEGSVELTLREASQLSLLLTDPGMGILGSAYSVKVPGELRNEIAWLGGAAPTTGETGGPSLAFTIAAIEQLPGPGPDDPRARLTARDFGVEALKLTNVGAGGQVMGDKPTGFDVSGKTISPTEYAAMQARYCGLRFVGQGTPRRTDIAPTKRDDGIYESPWEVLNRLADEVGFLVFCTDRTLYFGRPSWLASRAMRFKVGWHGSWGDLAVDTVNLPERRESIDTFTGATITFDLPRWRGEQVRPGMVADVKLTPTSEVTSWLVESVFWPVDRGQGDVTINGVEPVDPPTKAVQGAGDASNNAGTTSNNAGQAYTSEDGNADPNHDGKTNRIETPERVRLFGQPGDRARWKTWVTPWGLTVTVHELVLARFKLACARADEWSAWVPKRIDSAVVRNIAGSSSMSLHSFAVAWDFFSVTAAAVNAGQVPRWSVKGAEYAPDADFRNAFASAGFYLGAVFSTSKDYPHIEWADVPPSSATP